MPGVLKKGVHFCLLFNHCFIKICISAFGAALAMQVAINYFLSQFPIHFDCFNSLSLAIPERSNVSTAINIMMFQRSPQNFLMRNCVTLSRERGRRLNCYGWGQGRPLQLFQGWKVLYYYCHIYNAEKAWSRGTFFIQQLAWYRTV